MPGALADLIGPHLPPVCERAWTAFNDLSSTRLPSSGGVSPITFVEIGAYCHVMRLALTRLDVLCIRAADAVFLAEAHARATPSTEPDATPDPSDV